MVVNLNKARKRVDVILDDASSFSVDIKVAEEADLRKGLDLSSEQLEKLKEGDAFHCCLESALNYLAYRARSGLEIKQRLRKLGFNDNVVNKILEKLKEQKLIDDMSFANDWKESRINSNPRSKRLIKYELMAKGISGETALEAINDLDDSVNAYKAGLKKARLMVSLSYEEFRKRLLNYLKWRGFSYKIINNAIERLWNEKENISK